MFGYIVSFFSPFALLKRAVPGSEKTRPAPKRMSGLALWDFERERTRCDERARVYEQMVGPLLAKAAAPVPYEEKSLNRTRACLTVPGLRLFVLSWLVTAISLEAFILPGSFVGVSLASLGFLVVGAFILPCWGDSHRTNPNIWLWGYGDLSEEEKQGMPLSMQGWVSRLQLATKGSSELAVRAIYLQCGRPWRDNKQLWAQVAITASPGQNSEPLDYVLGSWRVNN